MTHYCPVGDGAFEDWVKKCPECGRTLVNVPPDRSRRQETLGNPAWLINAPNEPEAMMWAATLRTEGIDVMLRPGGPGAGAWASSATFEHALYVRSRDLDAARRVVRALLSGGGNDARPRARLENPPRVNPARRNGSAHAARLPRRRRD
jgi:hypothetical protein